MINCCEIKFKKFSNKYGDLTPIEGKVDIPFEVKRVYYITNVDKDIVRGNHSHKTLHQILICLNGSVKVKVKTPFDEDTYTLNRSDIGLYIGPMIWREMYDFSENSVLLVLASELYDEDEYIRNYDFYVDEANSRFLGGLK